MSTFVESLCTVEVDKFSELVTHARANTELDKAKSYERMYYATYGPFTVGGYKYELRVLPLDGQLNFYFCFLDNASAGAFQKYGFIVLLQERSTGNWLMGETVRLNHEKNFLFSNASINISGLPVTEQMIFWTQKLPSFFNKDDCLLVKFVFWVLLDSSKVGPPKPMPQPDPKPNQPSNPPPDFIGTLLTGQFADIYFVVKEQTFAAHRAILAARSSVFQSELLALQGQTSSNNLHVSVQHLDALTFKYLLHFIYTDSLPADFEETTRRYKLMFIAAYRFKIEGLKSICEKKLTKAVIESIVTTLELIEPEEYGLLKIVPKDGDQVINGASLAEIV